MAEGVVTLAVERLGELLISEAKLLYGVRDEIIKVQRQMRNTRAFLKEADKKQIRDARVREWVVQMRELAFRLEDVIETFALEIPIKNQKSSFKDMLKRFVCILSECVSRHNIATEIDSINADIAELTAKLPTFGITKGLEEGQSSEVDLKSQRKFYPHNVEKDFIGMEKEMEQVISRLKNTESGCEVVSIFGMGGQGKTTLAQKLYNHPEVKNHFKALAWVCISQQFDREKVLKEILEQIFPPDRKKDVSNMNDTKLVREVYEMQQEKSCLIVIDDIWTISSWEKLKHAFPIGETTSGSKILFTTRDQSVADIGFLHKIPPLTEEQGWQLLSKKAQINDNSEKNMISEMERIGRNMVNRCEGLPLAIASLGGILKGKLLREWETINKDISFHLAKGNKGITNSDEYYTVMQVLGLSYECLPLHLKHCFLYFSNYMEDEEIRTDKLYMLWVAEGLILAEDKADGESMLDVAERYLDELAHRSLVQVETDNFQGASWSKYMSCRVHDLIRDLCLSKAKEEKFIDVIHLKRKPEDFLASRVRRLCIRFFDEQVEPMLNCNDQHVISHIRSLYVWKEYSGTEVVQWLHRILSLKKFRLLRVLTVSNYNFTVQTMSRISQLTYLKYLSLSECNLKELPESIGNLRNLVYLDISVNGVIRIPNVLWKLKQLKYLYLPKRIEKGSRTGKLRLEGLNELEMLRNYNTRYCDENELIQLSKLTHLDAELQADNNLIWNIINFLKSRDMRHSQLAIVGVITGDAESLSCLPSLLECSINILVIWAFISILPKEYDHTRFSAHLSILSLAFCRMEEDPMILLEKLPGLRALRMQTDAYLGVDMVCSSGGFPQLTELFLSQLPGLSKWRLDKGAMPNLCSLYINDCKELEMLPNGLTFLIALEQLHVTYMPSTFTDRMQVIDDIEGEDYYKVRHISHISIKDVYSL